MQIMLGNPSRFLKVPARWQDKSGFFLSDIETRTTIYVFTITKYQNPAMIRENDQNVTTLKFPYKDGVTLSAVSNLKIELNGVAVNRVPKQRDEVIRTMITGNLMIVVEERS